MRRGVIIALALLMPLACVTNEASYKAWEHSRIANCKQRFSPYDPELERCLEQAQLPYDEYEDHRQHDEPKADGPAE